MTTDELEPCKREMRYDVTVWNTFSGDIIDHMLEATQTELDDLREMHDEPWEKVVVDREWEVEIDE